MGIQRLKSFILSILSYLRSDRCMILLSKDHLEMNHIIKNYYNNVVCFYILSSYLLQLHSLLLVHHLFLQQVIIRHILIVLLSKLDCIQIRLKKKNCLIVLDRFPQECIYRRILFQNHIKSRIYILFIGKVNILHIRF